MNKEANMRGLKACCLFACEVAATVVLADGCKVTMYPGEHWWGVCNNFGREMPFTEKSDFSCDLRLDNYSHQSLSFFSSDKGRVVWCAEPVGVKVANGTISLESDKGDIVLKEDAVRNLGEAFPLRGMTSTCLPTASFSATSPSVSCFSASHTALSIRPPKSISICLNQTNSTSKQGRKTGNHETIRDCRVYRGACRGVRSAC